MEEVKANEEVCAMSQEQTEQGDIVLGLVCVLKG
jgi:hypothetical protein